MKEDSNVTRTVAETQRNAGGPCGGAMERRKRNYRRLRSQDTHRIIHQPKDKPSVAKGADPTAWYVVQTRRYKELESRNMLNTPKGFKNLQTNQPYHVEAYAAVQEDEGNRLVIHGKIFVRVDEANRIDVLRKCMYLKGYFKDPALSRTESGFTAFARVPDREIEQLKAILQMADGSVEHSDAPFGLHDMVKIKKGILSKSEILKDVQGTVELVNGKKRATIVLDKLGVFRFNLPVELLRKK